MDALLLFIGIAGLLYMLAVATIMWQMGKIEKRSIKITPSTKLKLSLLDEEDKLD
jgi:hypothetical protein